MALPAASVASPGGDGGDDRAGAGHAGHGHVVGGARAGDGGRVVPAGRAGEGHVAGGKAGDRLAEDDGEVDGAGVGGIDLADRLVDGDRGGDVVVGDGVVGARWRPVLALPAASVATPGGDAGDDRAGAGHAGHGHVVGGARAGDGGRRACPGRAG